MTNSMRDIYHKVTTKVDKKEEIYYKAIQRSLDRISVETFKNILKEFLSTNKVELYLLYKFFVLKHFYQTTRHFYSSIFL